MKSSVFQLGAMRMYLEQGGLRTITYHHIEIVRGIYVAVRDRDWGTIAPTFEEVRLSEDDRGLSISFMCSHREDEIDFSWEGKIRMEKQRLRFEFDGKANSDFYKNRIGFCVLHPQEFAGLPVVVASPDNVIQGCFPQLISAHQPYKEIQELCYEPAHGLKVRMSFAGDLFEMEDQRNWTDASFKTYCTPLELPFPVFVTAGHNIKQTIEIQIEHEFPLTAETAETAEACARITIQPERICQLPELGFMLPPVEASETEEEHLAGLRPGFLRVVADQNDDDWMHRLERAGYWSAKYGCELELELILGAAEHLQTLFHAIKINEWPVRRILPYAGGSFISDAVTIRAVKQQAEIYALPVDIGGGTRAYYAELNRATLPLTASDFLSYSINPQVHACDDRSVMETLSAQRVTAEDAWLKFGKPLYIGPITFKPRLNPNATSSDELTQQDQIDVRQNSAYGAAWTLGSITNLCLDHVRSICYYDLFGPLGLVHGAVNPICQVFKDVAACKDADVMRVSTAASDVAALALRDNDRIRLLLANLTDGDMETKIAAGQGSNIRLSARTDSSRPVSNVERDDQMMLTLAPYEYLWMDFEQSFAGEGE
jgi:D-apionolactonase